MISVLHPRDMEQPVVTLDETNGWFQHKRPLTLRLVKVVSWSIAAGRTCGWSEIAASRVPKWRANSIRWYGSMANRLALSAIAEPSSSVGRP
jgi:hypothetical protein